MLPQAFTAWLTINRSCNLRCEWCYAQSVGFAKNDMSTDTVEATLAMFRPLQIKTVFLIGGEPTLHPHFIKIIKMISDADLKPMLITNSIAFRNEEFLDRAIEAGLLGITTSLKGVNTEQYQQFTRRNSFADVTSALRTIESRRQATGLFHRVSVTMCRSLFDNIDELTMVLRDNGVGEFSIDTERPVFMDGEPRPVQDMTPKDTASLLVAAYPKIKQAGVKFSIKISLPFCLFPQAFISELRERGELLSGCQLAAGSGIIIDPEGNLLPCNHFCENKLGALRTDFVTGEQFLQFRKRDDVSGFFQTMSNCPDKRCQGCSQWASCGGGCRMHWFCNGADKLLPSEKGGEEVSS